MSLNISPISIKPSWSAPRTRNPRARLCIGDRVSSLYWEIRVLVPTGAIPGTTLTSSAKDPDSWHETRGVNFRSTLLSCRIKSLLRSLQGKPSSDSRRSKSSWHLLLDLKLGPPSRAMAGHEHSRIELRKLVDRLFNPGFVRPDKVIPSHHGVQRDGASSQLYRILHYVHHTSMAAAGEYHHSFACMGR